MAWNYDLQYYHTGPVPSAAPSDWEWLITPWDLLTQVERDYYLSGGGGGGNDYPGGFGFRGPKSSPDVLGCHTIRDRVAKAACLTTLKTLTDAQNGIVDRTADALLGHENPSCQAAGYQLQYLRSHDMIQAYYYRHEFPNGDILSGDALDERYTGVRDPDNGFHTYTINEYYVSSRNIVHETLHTLGYTGSGADEAAARQLVEVCGY